MIGHRVLHCWCQNWYFLHPGDQISPRWSRPISSQRSSSIGASFCHQEGLITISAQNQPDHFSTRNLLTEDIYKIKILELFRSDMNGQYSGAGQFSPLPRFSKKAEFIFFFVITIMIIMTMIIMTMITMITTIINSWYYILAIVQMTPEELSGYRTISSFSPTAEVQSSSLHWSWSGLWS